MGKTHILLMLSTFCSVVSCRIDNINLLPLAPKAKAENCAGFDNNERFDCFPDGTSTQEACEARGCCRIPADLETTKADENSALPNVPWCFFPRGYSGYKFINFTETQIGKQGYLQRTFQSPFPKDVNIVKMDVEHQTDTRVRIKLSDANIKRFEAPYPKIARAVEKAADNPQYEVNINVTQGTFQVSRKNGAVIFDTKDAGGLIFANQFLQIGSRYNGTLYGLGEHRTSLWIEPGWNRFTMFNHDTAPAENTNIYGSHPFYVVIDETGSSYGVFLHNSNGMDVMTTPLPGVTFRAIGGILDLYFFLGPTPADVLRQYTELVGRPKLPPYWGLGFHLCRHGYDSSAKTREVWQRNIDAGIPFDVQWNDIDYMINQNDFTIDPVNFGDLPQLVDDIHKAGMHYVLILDPGVSASEPAGTYPPWDDGVSKDVFVKDKDGNIFIGKTWNPTSTAYPDFFHSNALDYWETLFRSLHDKVPFDGMWIDMNEPSNFLDGTFDGCPQDELEKPPYIPGVSGGKLSYKTICMNAKQAAGLHYDVHNLYGISESEVTYNALKNMGKRPFVVSRSTFSGSGVYSGHWGGDNLASWYDLNKSIPELLTFSLYGIPFMGSDICGFREDTWEGLCNRWMQLGAFYPFSRNHNRKGPIDQDPAALGELVIASSKKALSVRYSLLPYLYTLFYHAHVSGDTVARPLFVEFPDDSNTHKVDKSFLWGSGLYIIPVTEENTTSVSAYLPTGKWFDWYTGNEIESFGAQFNLSAPLDTIPLLIRGGIILPIQNPATTTTLTRKNHVTILIAPDSQGNASGTLYWDDGEVIDPVENNAFGFVRYTLSGKTLTNSIDQWNTVEEPIIERLQVLGSGSVNSVTVNGNKAEFHVDEHNVLTVSGLIIPLSRSLTASWT